MRPDGPRDPVTGPDSGPEAPFPIKLSGPVIAGFGRGSKELGIPTANIPPTGLSAYPSLPTGVYYGLVGLRLCLNSSTTNPNQPSQQYSDEPIQTSTSQHHPPPQIYEAVLSIGYNPFYNNRERSIEIHILHSFAADFYGAPLNLLVLGYIRPEYDYVSKESLIDDIRTDCEVARKSLAREAYRRVGLEGNEGREWLLDFGWVEKEEKEKEKEKEKGGDARI